MVARFNITKNKKFEKFLDTIFPDVVLWAIILFLFVFTIDWKPETLHEDIREIVFNFVPYVIAIYINFFFFKFLFLKKKYIWYIIISVITYVLFFKLILWIRVNYIPQRNDDIIFSIFLFSFVYVGFRYLITAPREILKFKNEETKRMQAERDLQEMEAKHSRAELEILKSQLNPHFLFNSLNNIYSLTLTDAKRAGESVLTLSDLMRYNLESSKKKYVTIKHEVEFIENYIQLESLRVSEICKISFHAEGDFKSKAIAPMILISFVENCFKHGISTNSSKNFIDISIKLEENILVFNTKNSIAPPRMDITKKEVNIGIENVKRRLMLLYPNKYELIINSDNGLYSVKLKIEL